MAGTTIVGLLLRLSSFDDALFADETSTYFIANSDTLGGVIDLVRSDQEVTPPLYFVLAWATEGLGDPVESLRLVSLIAGVAAIPLTYQLGALTVGRPAAGFGAALVAVSPILTFYSTEARAYMLMLFFVLSSSVALVKGTESGRKRWWIAYAAATSAAIWTHYTAVFVLAAQFGWAMWLRPRARPALLAANLAAALSYIPWLVSGLGEDRSSPGNLLAFVHPFSFDSAVTDLGQWAIGQSLIPLTSLPGDAAIALIVAGAILSALGVAVAIHARDDRPGRPPDGALLVLALALASPVGAVLYSLAVDSLMSPRNLVASWPGLALAVGAAVSSGRGVLRLLAVVLLLGGFSIGAFKMLDADNQRPDNNSVAGFIEHTAGPESPVLELPFSANPVSPLEVALNDPGQSLDAPREVLRVGVPARRAQERLRALGVLHSFRQPPPPTEKLAMRAARLARGDTLFVVTTASLRTEETPESVLAAVPPRFQPVEARTFPGVVPVSVHVFRDRQADAAD